MSDRWPYATEAVFLQRALDIEADVGRIEAALRDLQGVRHCWQSSVTGPLFELCESPIEQLFLVGLLSEGTWAGIDGVPNAVKADTTIVEVQKRVAVDAEVFRVDFALWEERTGIAVELDGHDWHERTKEQAERDKSRDRKLLAAGIPVVRFAGSEIWRDPWAAAREALSIVDDCWLQDMNLGHAWRRRDRTAKRDVHEAAREFFGAGRRFQRLVERKRRLELAAE